MAEFPKLGDYKLANSNCINHTFVYGDSAIPVRSEL